MNQQLTNKRLVPKKAIIIYDDKNRENSYAAGQYYLESRTINFVENKFSFGPAVPLANDVMKDIARAYMKNNSFEMDFGALIAEHILFGKNTAGKTIVMWWRPAGKRKLNFSSSLGIKSREKPVNLPPTLYVAINSKLYVFALAESTRPTRSTKLYNAPFFNIYQDGNVCLGSANVGKVRAKTFELEAERFERGFYMAEQNNELTQNLAKDKLKTIWTNVLRSGRPFPAKSMLKPHPTFKTLEDLIQKLISKR